VVESKNVFQENYFPVVESKKLLKILNPVVESKKVAEQS